MLFYSSLSAGTPTQIGIRVFRIVPFSISYRRSSPESIHFPLRILTNSAQYTGTPCPRTVTGFCRCFAFRIGKIHDHNVIIRNFQFRKFLSVKSNLFSISHNNCRFSTICQTIFVRKRNPFYPQKLSGISPHTSHT